MLCVLRPSLTCLHMLCLDLWATGDRYLNSWEAHQSPNKCISSPIHQQHMQTRDSKPVTSSFQITSLMTLVSSSESELSFCRDLKHHPKQPHTFITKIPMLKTRHNNPVQMITQQSIHPYVLTILRGTQSAPPSVHDGKTQWAPEIAAQQTA
ncbi:hypothetical protein BJ878DRAFT_150031 [Calycina marina]|uniref:Uncharacterized protein n=1 Tax=Calycina marina TaxID=1763456 RepID=A0A9P7YZX0_9HELO|nr:hypothetical protein BJ878DRAFT_150031 [Calycina marina]